MSKAIFVIIFGLLIQLFSQTAIAPSAGDGSEGNPYQIASLENLYWIAHYYENWDKHYIQTADIDASVTSTWGYLYGEDIYLGWSPIGNNFGQFIGSYDGQGYIIKGIYINRPWPDGNRYIGLFGWVKGAIISNIGLTNTNITGYELVGSLVGLNDSASSIINCFSSGYVNGKYCGGLVGINDNSSSIVNSYSSASVTGSYIGGLAGANFSLSKIEYCYSSGVVVGAGSYYAGMGGLVGFASDSEISHCYSVADVFGNDGNCVGGLIGANEFSIITNCYSIGQVTGTNKEVGGMLGTNRESLNLNCFWNLETSAQITSPAGSVQTTAEMIKQETYIDWNFTEVWSIQENNSYPYLKWQSGPEEFNIVTPFVPPHSLTAIPGNNSSSLVWQAPSLGNPSGYKVYRDSVLVTTLNPEILSFEDSGLMNYTFYTYNVKALYNSNESNFSNTVTICPNTGFQGGDGTADNPYLVSSPLELFNIGLYLNCFFKQIADIDFNGTQWSEGEGWVPLGDDIYEFSGSYNGDGHIINELFINRSDGEYFGLFGYISGSTIANLNFTNINIKGYKYVGSLSGYAINSTIENVNCSGSVVGSYWMGGMIGIASSTNMNNCKSSVVLDTVGGYTVGGLFGVNSNASIISCYSTGKVTGQGSIGGLAAGISGCTMTGCYSTSNVFGTGNVVGGLVGSTSQSVINYCFSTGNVESEADYVGGLVGNCTESSTIQYSYSLSSVKGNYYVGGLIGLDEDGSLVSNSFSMGSAAGDQFVGGLSGIINYSQINKCYSTASVNGNTYFGGLLGYEYFDIGNVFDSFWDIEASGQAASFGGTGLTTAEMKTLPTFTDAGWDFVGETDNGTEDIWEIDPLVNDGYPFLSNLTVGIADEQECVPVAIQLSQNYPNPFNPETKITFSIPSAQDVKLTVYNSNGQLVRKLINEKLSAGKHSKQFNGDKLNSGVYFYTLQTGEKKLTRKMLMIK